MCTGAVYTLLALRKKWLTEKQQRILPLRSNVSISDVVQGIPYGWAWVNFVGLRNCTFLAFISSPCLCTLKMKDKNNSEFKFKFNFKIQFLSICLIKEFYKFKGRLALRLVLLKLRNPQEVFKRKIEIAKLFLDCFKVEPS